MGIQTKRVNYASHWSVIHLHQICHKITDGTHFTPQYRDSGIPFISVKDIYNDAVHFSQCKYIDLEEHQELYKRCNPEHDDLLITKSGTIGRMAIVPKNPEFSLFVSVALIKPIKHYLTTKFLKYCLENYLNSISIDQDIKGGLLKNFHLEDMRLTEVPLVSLTEQNRIVSKIDELFSSLDKGIESLDTALKELKIYRQAVLKYAFEGRLTNKSLSNELPVGWVWTKLGNVADKISNKVIPSELPGAKFIGMDCISPNTIKPSFMYEFKEFKSAGNVFEKGNVLYGRMRPYLNKVYKAEFDGVCSGEFIILKCKNEFHPELLKYILHSQEFVKFASSKTSGDRPRVSFEELVEYPIAKPLPQEQIAIIGEIESRLSVCDKIEDGIIQSLAQSESLRQSILKKAFEGKLVPQDQNDEPAEKLLERIKAEKEKVHVTKKTKRIKEVK